jgi:hypothetical protein
MQRNREIFTILDGTKIEDATDYQRLAAMSEKDVMESAKADPDAQPLSETELRRFHRLSSLPGGNFLDKMRFFWAKENGNR